ncbi:hypothetical protein [Streptomyces sp. WG5]|uniref:hypothetical protein n=1 Tax=Streptomyces sp. WG5 TaxID=3417648 RepID=UPI003CF9B525
MPTAGVRSAAQAQEAVRQAEETAAQAGENAAQAGENAGAPAKGPLGGEQRAEADRIPGR